MNIGINGYYLSGGSSGIGQYTNELLQALSKFDKNNEYFVFVSDKISYSVGAHIHFIHTPHSRYFKKTFFIRYYWEEFQLTQRIEEYKIDLFHSPYLSLPNLKSIPLLATVHDTIPWEFPYYKRDLVYWWYLNQQKRNVVSRAESIITDSHSSKCNIKSTFNYPADKISVIYPAVDPAFSVTPRASEKDLFIKENKIKEPYIVYSGGFQKHKNIKNLLCAVELLVKNYSFKGKLYILGEIRRGSAVSSIVYEKMEYLKRIVQERGLANCVVFTGFIPSKTYIQYQKFASLFVSLSLQEGFGLPALEALSCAKPIVLADNETYREIEKDAVVFVNPADCSAVANALHSLLSNPKQSEKFTLRAVHIRGLYGREKMAKGLLDCYTKTISQWKK